MVAENQSIILSIRDLETRFGSHRIHSGLSLDVYKGELLVLFGGSGTGKSTLLRAIIGLDPVAGGSILLENQELTQLNAGEWRDVRRKIGYSFQSGALFDSLTVAENLEYPLQEFTRMTGQQRREAATDMLERIALPGIEKLYPSELSGGMQKRVGMARALMLNPPIILYDEPTAGLDPANAKMITALMQSLKSRGTTGILVTHDVPCALAIGDRIAFLQAGKIAIVQNREQIKDKPDERIMAYINGEVA